MNNTRSTNPSRADLPVGQMKINLFATAKRLLLALRTCGVAILAAAALISGCESGGGDGDGGNGGGGGSGGGAAVGTWSLTNGGSTWYILFAADGSWLISDTADGSSRRVFGSYTMSGDSISGSMTNPGVGSGEIAATISGDSISLDFIEHWHTPYKHVPYTGTRLN